MENKNKNWMNELLKKYSYGIGNVFILTGNISDYVIKNKFIDEYIYEIFKDNFDNIICYDYDNMSRNLMDENEGITFDDILEILENDGKNMVIFRYPQYVIPSIDINTSNEVIKLNTIALHRVINSKEFLNSDNMVIFISESIKDINNIFIGQNSRSHMIKIDYPNEEERLDFIKYKLNDRTLSKSFEWEIDEKYFSKMTSGLTNMNIEDICLLAISRNKLTKNIIINKKKELIEKEFSDVIELFDVDEYSLENFAGQDIIKAYHEETIIKAFLSGDEELKSIVPKGILYIGPPGTGKTYFAKCLAGKSKINFVEFKISKILDKYVGESEKNLEKAFSCFESLSPCGIFIDELDQVLSRGNEESNNVRNSIFGAFLSFMSEPEHRGKIIFIGATNYPNRLDEALKRPGRFDKKIPFLLPTLEDREKTFKIHFDKLKYKCNFNDYRELSLLTDGYTQAEIEDITIKTLELTKRKGKDLIELETVKYAIECVIPRNNAKVKEMIDIAIKECNDTEFLPKEYRERDTK